MLESLSPVCLPAWRAIRDATQRVLSSSTPGALPPFCRTRSRLLLRAGARLLSRLAHTLLLVTAASPPPWSAAAGTRRHAAYRYILLSSGTFIADGRIREIPGAINIRLTTHILFFSSFPLRCRELIRRFIESASGVMRAQRPVALILPFTTGQN